jgi:hypothetical protein
VGVAANALLRISGKYAAEAKSSAMVWWEEQPYIDYVLADKGVLGCHLNVAFFILKTTLSLSLSNHM